MVTREQSLKRFIEKADWVISGNYLFASKKIEDMLIALSSSRLLFEIIEHCCNGENPDKLKAKYFVAGDGIGSGSFTMPEKQTQAVALCIYVLKEIADGDIDFSKFLATYFPGKDVSHENYNCFINTLIVPFKNTVKTLAETVISAKEIRDRRGSSAEKKVCDIDKQYLLGLRALLEEDKRTIVYSGNRDEVSLDMLCILDNFVAAVANYEIKNVKPLFIAYKYANMHIKKIKLHYDEVEELLVDHGVIDE